MTSKPSFGFSRDTIDQYHDMDMEEAPIWGKVEALAESDEGDADFQVLRAAGVSSSRPLVIWVHPGDSCESDSPDIAPASLALEGAMADELMDFKDCDLVVLHRFSSQYAFESDGRVHPDYYAAMGQALKDDRVAHLYGDDLNAASDWMLENMELEGRPEILLTGAWSDPEHGCVAAVGQALHAAGAPGIRVSRSSPSEPGVATNVWQPEMPLPASARRPAGPS